MSTMQSRTNAAMNLYWPVYKNIEKELLVLAEEIHFDDSQLCVYSVKICDLLLRTVVEIEAISKELYFANGGTPKLDDNNKEIPPYFDDDCLAHLERLWTLSKKRVFISAPTFYFEEQDNKILLPLNKASKRGKGDWKKAYQAIKHNRTINIKEGNIKHLIRALAALYLLNIYYKDETITGLSNDKKAASIDERLNSEIFSIQVVSQIGFSPRLSENNQWQEGAVNATYIIKHTEQSYRNIAKKQREGEKKQKDFLMNSPEFLQFIQSGNVFAKGEDIITLGRKIGAWHLKQKLASATTFADKKQMLLNSSEYNNFARHNNNSLPEESTEDNIENVIEQVGGYAYMQKLWQCEREYLNTCFHSVMEAALNKNQQLYPDINEKEL